MNKLKIIIVHEWLANYTGTERVVESYTGNTLFVKMGRIFI